MEIDPRLVAEWLLFPILNVALVQAALCNEVQGILKELLGCVRVFTRVAISWQMVHRLNRISGGSCRMYAAKNMRLFWRIVSGVGVVSRL